MCEYKQKFEKLLVEFNSMVKNKNGQKHQIKSLLNSLENKEKAKVYAIEKEQYLRNRIMQKYGAIEFNNLMNSIESPGQFDSERFLEKAKKFDERNNCEASL